MDNCTALFFNAVAVIHQSDPNSIWQCTCPLVNHMSVSFCAVIACTSCLQMCTAHMWNIGCQYISDALDTLCCII